MNLATFSIKRPVTVVVAFVSLLVLGLVAAQRIPLAAFPEVDAPFIYVALPYPGSTPEEVERTVVRPAEEALATLPGITQMFSNSSADSGGVFMQFAWDRDIQVVAQEARERMDAIRGELPDDFQRYQVLKFSSGDEAVLQLRFAGERDLTDSYALLDQQLRRRIERVPGVARLDIIGVAAPEVEVAIDPLRLEANGIALNELAGKLQQANFSVSAGEIDDGTRRLRVQPIGELASLDQLRTLVVGANGQTLADVAEVRLRPAKLDVGRRLEGRPAAGADIFKERNANLVDVARAALAEVEALADDPAFEGIQINVINNQGDNVTSSLGELVEAGVLGSVLSVVILFAFLRSWPSTLMVSLAIPVCFVITLGCMYFLDINLNILSMMGLLLGVGMLVDNAVVVVESIYQQREKYPGDPMRCAIEGTRGVQLAITAGTLTSIVVFLPNIFGEQNFISLYLAQVAYTITISLLASWLVAVTLIPLIASRLPTPAAATAKAGFIHWLQDRYEEALRWTLRRRGVVLVAIAAMCVVSFGPVRNAVEFDLGGNERGTEFDIDLRFDGTYPLPVVDAETKRVEDYLQANREAFQITKIYSYFSEQGGAGVMVTLSDELQGDETPETIIEKVRAGLPQSARAEITIGGQDGPPGSGDASGDESAISVSLVGSSSAELDALAEDLLPQLRTRTELRDVRTDIGDAGREVAVRVDRERAAAFGFNPREVAQYIGIALRGTPLREFRQGGEEVPVWVRFEGSEERRLEELQGFMLRASDGRSVPLTALVDYGVQSGAKNINRQNRQTRLQLTANLGVGPDGEPATMEQAREAITEVLDGVEFPAGYRYAFGGGFEFNEDAGTQMLFNTLIALVMVYIVMAALFESMLFPLAIFSGVLFSAMGVFWLFALTGTTFTIMASIGILVLLGVVVNNGIVMVEHINNLRREGVSRTEALVIGSRERLRPILMTMGTTILGMLPLCLGETQLGGGGPAYYPMARAIVGGLAFSTVVSLLFLPTIYAFLDDLRAATATMVRRAFQVGAGTTPAT